MGYIVCEKCGGYYELHEGESPEDFNDKCECRGNLKYVQELNDVDESQTNKIESKFMNFQSVVSIILGAIISFTLFGILSYVVETDKSALMITMIIFGGFIATYFSKEKKMLYGIYAGAVLFAICIFFYSNILPSGLIAEFLMISLFTGIGGFIGGIASKRLKKSSDFE